MSSSSLIRSMAADLPKVGSHSDFLVDFIMYGLASGFAHAKFLRT
ncbi:hypothetical protein AYI70_g9114, partial [Smittium culicis]